MRRFLPRFRWRENSGSAAIEFAMIAPVFLLLLFAILETSSVFYAEMILDNAVLKNARLIRTGQAQNQNMTQAAFRDAVCTSIQMLLPCSGQASDKLIVDVRSFTNFGTSSFPQALDAQGNLNANLNSYQPGGSSQATGQNPTVLVRVMYIWQLYTPMFAQYYENMGKGSGKRLIAFSAAFKNEPF
ncbi:MAG TPA: TadE/TadG family type IV pilus assembly protein [Micropepsaceae bacterium]|nr:TadE/TadG family type IV pilus assembly protein [Micropepsaceae bacterium]